MFDYNQLALNVAPEFNSTTKHEIALPAKPAVNNKSSFDDNVLRRLSGESNDNFDCSASSGYGSSGNGTPLASPALISSNFLSQNLKKMLNDCDINDHIGGVVDNRDLLSFLTEMSIDDPVEESIGKMSVNSGNMFSSPPQQSEFVRPKLQSQRSSCATPLSPAVEDGFSVDEIAQFSQLLCSPKKTPPTHYQCHICFQAGQHYISDCPMRFNSSYEELTPYQGRKKCYGEFTCGQCKRRWTSQNSVANEAQNCIKCSLPVFPHKQLPVDKAIALGLVKAQRTVPTKIAPIGSGRIAVRQ